MAEVSAPALTPAQLHEQALSELAQCADEAALKAYADSPAQKEWYKIYIPIREESTTFDITN